MPKKRPLLWSLGALAAIVAFRHAWMWLPTQRYQALITRPSLLSALQSSDAAALAHAAAAGQYRYQVFYKGRLTATNDDSLPALRFVRQPAVQAGIISAGLREQLAQTVPYQLQIALHRYVVFAVTPPAAPQTVYVVYGRVF